MDFHLSFKMIMKKSPGLEGSFSIDAVKRGVLTNHNIPL